MRVLICGDRNWWKSDPIDRFLAAIPEGSVVIHGGARGADTLAGRLAEARGLEVEVYPADWNKLGKSAGVIRNQQMLVEGKPDFVVYYHYNLKESKGTGDMVRRAKRDGIPVIDGLIFHGDDSYLVNLPDEPDYCCETYKEHGACMHSI